MLKDKFERVNNASCLMLLEKLNCILLLERRLVQDYHKKFQELKLYLKGVEHNIFESNLVK